MLNLRSLNARIFALQCAIGLLVFLGEQASAGPITSAVKSGAKAAAQAAGKVADTAGGAAVKATGKGATADAISGLSKELPSPSKGLLDKAPATGDGLSTVEPAVISPMPGLVGNASRAITKCASAARERNPSLTSETALRFCNERMKQCLERSRDKQQDGYQVCLAELAEFHANDAPTYPANNK